jgi:hypothetical protein
MTARTTHVCVAAGVLLALAAPATAQVSRLAVSGGYQITRAANQTLPIGWSGDVAATLSTKWSIVGEVSGAYRIEKDEDLGVDVRVSIHSFGAGARWSSRVATRILPFLQLLGGAARAATDARLFDTSVGDSATKFMVQPGGGVNLRVTETFGLGGQVDYRRVFVDDESGRSGGNQFRVVIGVRVSL